MATPLLKEAVPASLSRGGGPATQEGFNSQVDFDPQRTHDDDQEEDGGLRLLYDFHREFVERPISQLCQNPNTRPMTDGKEGFEVTREMVEGDEGIPSWSVAERVDGMTDLAPAKMMAKRSVWTKIGFHNRALFVLYWLSVMSLVGGLSYVIYTERNAAATEICYFTACDDPLVAVNASRRCENNTDPENFQTCTKEYCCTEPVEVGTGTVTLNADDDWSRFLLSLMSMLALLPIMYPVVFSILRRNFPLTYDSKAQLRARGNELGRRVSYKVLYVEFQARLYDPEADRIIQHTGLDGWMLLRFYTLGARMLSQVGFVILIVFAPLHVLLGKQDYGIGLDPLSAFGLNKIDDTIPAQKALYWVHAFFTPIVVFAIGKMLIGSQERFLAYRYGWLCALPRPRATTVMVDNIPKPYRSDEKLKTFFQKIMSREAVSKTYVVRRPELFKLNPKYQAYKAAEEKLRLVVDKWVREGKDDKKRPKVNEMEVVFKRLGNLTTWKFDSPETDAITKYKLELAEARNIFETAQAELEKEARTGTTTKVYGRTGFITFTSRKWQALALDRRYRADARHLNCELPPDPLDVIWSDLASSKRIYVARTIAGYIYLALMFALGIPLFAGVAGAMNGAFMKSTGLPIIEDIGIWLTNDTLGIRVDAALTGPVQPIIFSGLMALVPVFLMYPIMIIAALRTKSNLQVILQKYYFVYQLIFIIFGGIFGRNLIVLWGDIAENPAAVLQGLEKDLPSSTNFFLSLAVTSWSGVMVHLCRPIALAKFLAFRPLLGSMDSAVRAQTEDPAFFWTAVRMCKATTQLAFFIIFCIICPLISIPLLVYMMIARTVYRYLMLKAEDKRPDTGGLHWVIAMDQLWSCIWMFCFLMGYILWIRGDPYQSVLCFSGLIIWYRQWETYKSLEWRFLPLEKVVELDMAAEQVLGQWGAEYMQDECKPLKEDVELDNFAKRSTRGGSFSKGLSSDESKEHLS